MNLYELFSKCITVPYTDTGSAASYAMQKERSTLTLFFQGSDGRTDWKRNLDFPARPYKRMGKIVWYAHRGFLAAWKDIEPAVSASISDKSVKKIVIVGYSHGAAIAVLCHEYVWFHRPDLRHTTEGFGFGCPRVIYGGRKAAVKERWENFTVIRNIDDIVTHLPPSLFGYYHVGRMLTIGKTGKYTGVEAHIARNILNELRIYERTKSASSGE